MKRDVQKWACTLQTSRNLARDSVIMQEDMESLAAAAREDPVCIQAVVDFINDKPAILHAKDTTFSDGSTEIIQERPILTTDSRECKPITSHTPISLDAKDTIKRRQQRLKDLSNDRKRLLEEHVHVKGMRTELFEMIFCLYGGFMADPSETSSTSKKKLHANLALQQLKRHAPKEYARFEGHVKGQVTPFGGMVKAFLDTCRFGPRHVQYEPVLIHAALAIISKSEAAYVQLRTAFPFLPAPRTLQEYSHNTSFKEGLCPELLRNIYNTIQADDGRPPLASRVGRIEFDQMKVSDVSAPVRVS